MCHLKPPNYYLFYFSIHKKNQIFSFQFDEMSPLDFPNLPTKQKKINYSSSSNEHPS